MIALIILILIGVTTYQNQKVYEKDVSIEDKILRKIDSIAGRMQIVVMQNDSILNTLQEQSRFDTINIQELRGIRREKKQ